MADTKTFGSEFHSGVVFLTDWRQTLMTEDSAIILLNFFMVEPFLNITETTGRDRMRTENRRTSRVYIIKPLNLLQSSLLSAVINDLAAVPLCLCVFVTVS